MPPHLSPFDPFAWLAGKDTTAYLDAEGRIRLRFGQFVRQEDRERIRRVIGRWYLSLLRLQLEVPEGVRPRTVQQLMAAGKLRIGRDGRYVIVGGVMRYVGTLFLLFRPSRGATKCRKTS